MKKSELEGVLRLIRWIVNNYDIEHGICCPKCGLWFDWEDLINHVGACTKGN